MAHRNVYAFIIAVLISLFLKPVAARAQSAARAAESSTRGDYKLVLIISIDQFLPSYLTRFEDLFVSGGFRLLMERGASFTNCHYEHSATMTGPGHACISTGANPGVHGIAGNHWIEAIGQDSKYIFCTDDPATQVLANKGPLPAQGHSPRWLRAETLADAFKSQHPHARVVACSLKESPPAFLAGKGGQAFWWDVNDGHFVSSTFYMSALPDWVVAFNSSGFADRFKDQQWTRVLPAEQYKQRCRKDNVPFENGAAYGQGNAFPHPLRASRLMRSDRDFYRGIYNSPFGNDVVLGFARQALDALELGQRKSVDFLAISLSSNDTVGHIYGPDSHEVMDTTIRTDRQLAEFFKHVDQKVNLESCLIALTADHGVCRIPEYSRELGLDAGRFNRSEFKRGLEDLLTHRFGKPDQGRSYVRHVILPWVYLDGAVLDQQQVDAATLASAARATGKSSAGVDTVYMSSEIAEDAFASAGDVFRRRIKQAYVPDRSGQIYLHLKANWYGGGNATGHGGAHDYDAHVPLLIYGRGIKAGSYPGPASPTDLAATLAHVLGIQPPFHASGRVRHEALAKPLQATKPHQDNNLD